MKSDKCYVICVGCLKKYPEGHDGSSGLVWVGQMFGHQNQREFGQLSFREWFGRGSANFVDLNFSLLAAPLGCIGKVDRYFGHLGQEMAIVPQLHDCIQRDLVGPRWPEFSFVVYNYPGNEVVFFGALL